MNSSTLFSLFCAGLLISSLFIAGCMRDRAGRDAPGPAPDRSLSPPAGQASAPASATAPPVTGFVGRTCASLGGDICTAGEECTGSWLNAQDSFSCCSRVCTGSAGSGTILTIAPFEPSARMAEQDAISP